VVGLIDAGTGIPFAIPRMDEADDDREHDGHEQSGDDDFKESVRRGTSSARAARRPHLAKHSNGRASTPGRRRPAPMAQQSVAVDSPQRIV
jgi:hypothetical protein